MRGIMTAANGANLRQGLFIKDSANYYHSFCSIRAPCQTASLRRLAYDGTSYPPHLRRLHEDTHYEARLLPARLSKACL